MTRRLKVYGWAGFPIAGKGQLRCIIAATSMKEAARLADESYGFLREYGSETGNKQEVEAATARPGILFWRRLNDWNGIFKAVRP